MIYGIFHLPQMILESLIYNWILLHTQSWQPCSMYKVLNKQISPILWNGFFFFCQTHFQCFIFSILWIENFYTPSYIVSNLCFSKLFFISFFTRKSLPRFSLCMFTQTARWLRRWSSPRAHRRLLWLAPSTSRMSEWQTDLCLLCLIESFLAELSLLVNGTHDGWLILGDLNKNFITQNALEGYTGKVR